AGPPPRLEDYVATAAGPERSALLLELILLDAHYRQRRGEAAPPEEYQRRFPQGPSQLPRFLEAYRARPAGAPARGTTAQPLPAPGDAPGGSAADRLNIPGYQVLGVLGRGGMAVVYRARQVGLNRTVALKMILAGDHAGPQERARFRREAAAVARLQHPHVVQIYEVGEHEGRPYFALEYVDGGSLAQWLARVPPPARPAAPRSA